MRPRPSPLCPPPAPPSWLRRAVSKKPKIVEDLESGDEEADAEDRCAVCGVETWIEGNWLLLCDGDNCGKAYHTQCLSPKLDAVPDGDWLCPDCAPPRANVVAGGGAAAGSTSGSGELTERQKIHRQPDCGECGNCLDKPKYGGAGKKKQPCKLKQQQLKALPAEAAGGKRKQPAGAAAPTAAAEKRPKGGDGGAAAASPPGAAGVADGADGSDAGDGADGAGAADGPRPGSSAATQEAGAKGAKGAKGGSGKGGSGKGGAGKGGAAKAGKSGIYYGHENGANE